MSYSAFIEETGAHLSSTWATVHPSIKHESTLHVRFSILQTLRLAIVVDACLLRSPLTSRSLLLEVCLQYSPNLLRRQLTMLHISVWKRETSIIKVSNSCLGTLLCSFIPIYTKIRRCIYVIIFLCANITASQS